MLLDVFSVLEDGTGKGIVMKKDEVNGRYFKM
jgi:hypothetical protein